MTLAEAPLFTDVAPAPLPGAAYWAHASDGLRIRLGVWQPSGARGTVLLFPGRTEYIEKYGNAVGEIAARTLRQAARCRGRLLCPDVGHQNSTASATCCLDTEQVFTRPGARSSSHPRNRKRALCPWRSF